MVYITNTGNHCKYNSKRCIYNGQIQNINVTKTSFQFSGRFSANPETKFSHWFFYTKTQHDKCKCRWSWVITFLMETWKIKGGLHRYFFFSKHVKLLPGKTFHMHYVFRIFEEITINCSFKGETVIFLK